MLRGLGSALGPDDLLQPAPELGPLEARWAVREVLGELHGLDLIELTMEVVLDLGQNLFAANLGQGHAP